MSSSCTIPPTPTEPSYRNEWLEKAEQVSGTIAPQLDTLIKIADVLQVSLDELVGRRPVSTETRIRNHALNALWQQADVLPDQEQQALILVIDSFVKKAMVEKAMGKRSGGSKSKLAA